MAGTISMSGRRSQTMSICSRDNKQTCPCTQPICTTQKIVRGNGCCSTADYFIWYFTIKTIYVMSRMWPNQCLLLKTIIPYPFWCTKTENFAFCAFLQLTDCSFTRIRPWLMRLSLLDTHTGLSALLPEDTLELLPRAIHNHHVWCAISLEQQREAIVSVWFLSH